MLESTRQCISFLNAILLIINNLSDDFHSYSIDGWSYPTPPTKAKTPDPEGTPAAHPAPETIAIRG